MLVFLFDFVCYMTIIEEEDDNVGEYLGFPIIEDLFQSLHYLWVYSLNLGVDQGGALRVLNLE